MTARLVIVWIWILSGGERKGQESNMGGTFKKKKKKLAVFSEYPSQRQYKSYFG